MDNVSDCKHSVTIIDVEIHMEFNHPRYYAFAECKECGWIDRFAIDHDDYLYQRNKIDNRNEKNKNV